MNKKIVYCPYIRCDGVLCQICLGKMVFECCYHIILILNEYGNNIRRCIEHYENLPRTWCICKLNTVVNIVNGKTQKEVKDVNGVYPIYGSGGIIGYAKEYLCLSGSTIIGRKGTINNPILVNENFWNVDTAFGMKPIDIVDDAYFFYFCQSFDFSQLDKSTALPSLTKTVIGNLLLPVPPYNEQKRIVTVIRRYEQILNAIEESL